MRIIFHHPLPVKGGASSASGIRPFRMLEAFQALDCEVDLVCGCASDRKRGIAKIKENIKRGLKYDFVYSESSTMPTVLTERHHLPVHPFMDWMFFRFCNRRNIPIGLFYRDIYWAFSYDNDSFKGIKASVAKAAYFFDLWVYRLTLSKLYLPSIEMGHYVPIVDPKIFKALPPGHNLSHGMGNVCSSEAGVLKLFYVGGMSAHYELQKLFSVVRELPQVELIVCTREAEWAAVRNSYPDLTFNIKVIHKTGGEMEAFLRQADIAVLFVKPQEYREFASPVKLYEYLGHQKPILASEGTLSGRFVKNEGIGWTIPYDEHELKSLLEQLLLDSQLWEPVRENLAKVAPRHSWQSRAQQVIDELVS